MLLAPSRTKYRRQHRGRMKGAAQRGNALAFGQYGLQALEPCWMEARQIEAARIALTRFMKRGGKVWIRVFPDKPITAKPAETRMGSGKGAVDHWVAVVKPGRIIFEIGGVSEEVAKEAVRLASHKLPVASRFITRGEAESVEA
jgi:large subunit ribosomal protein L16